MAGSSTRDDPAVDRFLEAMRTWIDEGDSVPNVVNLRVTDGIPSVVFQVESDRIEDVDAAAEAHRAVTGGCVGSLQHADHGVDRVFIVGLPADRERHEGGVRWRLEAEWTLAHEQGRISTEELEEFVDTTAELLGNP